MLSKINRKSELSPSLKSFDDMFNNMLKHLDPFYCPEMPFQNHNFGRMEMEIKENEIIAKLPLPGCKNDEIEVEIENDILTVKACKNCCCKDDNVKNKLIRHERHYETFEESVKLPTTIDAKKSSAQYKHGVLTVKLAKSEAEKNEVHIIEIN